MKIGHDYMSPPCDFHFDESKSILSHDTVADDDVSPYHTRLRMVMRFRRYRPDKHD